jgi:AcrR family transcriptional regulator
LPRNLKILENETKSDILKTTESLFNQFGIKSVSMDDVASKLGVSKKTLYKYYNSKDELVKEVLLNKLGTFHGCIIQIQTDGDAIDEVLSVFKNVSEVMSKNNPVMIYDLKKYYPKAFSLFEEFRNQKIREHFLNNLKRGVAEGLYRKNVNGELLARIYFNIIEFISGPDLVEIEPDFRKRYSEVFVYHLRGICSEKGLEKIKVIKI